MTMNLIQRRNLWLYALTTSLSRFGNQFQFFAVTSLTYAITGSTLLTGTQMAATGLPYILLANSAGSVADRYDPRRVSSIALLMQSVLTLGYVFTSNIVHYLVLNFFVSSCGVFILAAKGALIPQMVGKQNVFKANARLASFNGAAQLLAPLLAGAIIMRIDPVWAFRFNSLSYLAPAIGMFYVQAVETVERKTNTPAGLGEAWRFVLGTPLFRSTLLLYGAFTIGMWSVNTLFYPYCVEILGRGMDVMGASVSAYFGSFMITGYALERWGNRLRNPKLLPTGFIIGSLIWAGYCVTNTPWVAVLLSAFDGIVYTYTVTRLDTWIQEEAPAEQRGRVSALVRAWDEVATISGQIGGGAIAAVIGVIGGIFWSSAISLMLVIGILLAQPRGRFASEKA